MLVLDFETHDPYITQGYGAGWVFAIRGYTNPEFKLLGASLKWTKVPKELEDEVCSGLLGGETLYIDDLDLLREQISLCDTFIMHNAQYDIGCLLVLFDIKPEGIKEFLENKTFYDTMLMAKLVNQSYFQYGLEFLSKKLGGATKQNNTLTDYVWESGLYQYYYHEERGGNKHKRPSEKVLGEFVKSHMDLVPVEIMAEYCNADVEATHSLFVNYEYQLQSFSREFDWNTYSTLLKACVDMRARGVRIDVEHAKKTKIFLEQRVEELTTELYHLCNAEFNINAPKQVLAVMEGLGLSGFGLTATGNLSVNKEWMSQQAHPACALIIKIKNYSKLAKDFLAKLIDYQQIHTQNGVDSTRIFPSLNIFGATATGRFSSSGSRPGKKSFELNIQQIPIRGEDEEAGRYVRACFLADEGEIWLSADYSNQEQRLQVHFAHYLNLPTAREFAQILIDDPYVDFHQTVADFCGITRRDAKTINLGLSYGMGGAKLCRSLGLPTEMKWIERRGKDIEVPGVEGEKLLKKYHNFLTFMKALQTYANDTIKNYGYVKTLAGRRLYIDKAIKIDDEWVSFERKGLSKLVQGSGADVTIQAIVNCYNRGLKLLFTVHDEINITTGQPDSDDAILDKAMDVDVRAKFNILVPMAVEISKGKSWAD